MDKPKLLYLEDTASAIIKVDYLRDYEGYDVWVTSDFRDVMSWLLLDPGAEDFEALIFDLKVKPYSLNLVKGNVPYDSDKFPSTSMYFIEQFLLKHDKLKNLRLKDKVILCSAYIEIYKKQGLNLDGYRVVHKDNDATVNLIQEINEIRAIMQKG